MAKPIHQEVTFNGTPEQFYDAYMNEKKRAKYTEGATTISMEEGGTFSCHGGTITGRNIELVPGKRIVQAWRVAGWPDGMYTTVQFELSESDGKTQLVMDHCGVPDEFEDGVASGWHARYWEPLQKFLA
ncbi:MAG: SRPBCC domain-containing protein [Nannocystaceae bacterium]|nr:SRPBCC domain-containing protein [Nannocystaceae bacterium]